MYILHELTCEVSEAVEQGPEPAPAAVAVVVAAAAVGGPAAAAGGLPGWPCWDWSECPGWRSLVGQAREVE